MAKNKTKTERSQSAKAEGAQQTRASKQQDAKADELPKIQTDKQQGAKTEQSQTARVDTLQNAKTKRQQVAKLIVLLVVVLVGGVLFVGAASGWFESMKVNLSAEYYCEECDGALTDLTAEEYDQLIAEKKSFIVVIDQGGCTTAERLKEYAGEFAKGAGVRMYRMMFSDMKETSLHEKVKYYPSVVVINKGRVWAYLRADSDEDSDAYNKYEAFEEWMKRYL